MSWKRKAVDMLTSKVLGQGLAKAKPRATVSRLRTRVMVFRPSEFRQFPAEVQLEVARDPVTHTADLGAARLCTGQGQQWEEQVAARLKLASCRRPEPIDLGLSRG